MRYSVKMRIEGEYSTEVEAKSFAEAEETALKQGNFGELENIEGYVFDIWEKREREESVNE